MITNSPIKRVLLQHDSSGRERAVGAELLAGQTIQARKEVIVCCSAIRTLQLLMLSGIGPAEELAKHSIEQLLNAPEVGRNFIDHGTVTHFIGYATQRKDSALHLLPLVIPLILMASLMIISLSTVPLPKL